MKRSLFQFIFLFFASSGFAQFAIYDTLNSGIKSNYCYVVLETKAGEVWVGTAVAGLNKFSNHSNWTTYNTNNSGVGGNYIKALYYSNGQLWSGSYGSGGGVSVFNDTTWGLYNTSNSGICGDDILSITKDIYGNLWIATRFNGFSKYDGTTWVTYNKQTSIAPTNAIYQLEADPTGGIWVSFPGYGFAKISGTHNWTFYNTSTSPIPSDDVYALKYNKVTKSLWIGTLKGLAVKYENYWAVHTPSTINIPGGYIRSITHNYNTGNTWLAFGDAGIGKWDRTKWTAYNMSNSNLPSNSVWWITTGANNAIWAATFGKGLVHIRDEASTQSIEESSSDLAVLYPNPTSDVVHITFKEALPGDASIRICDVAGREIYSQDLSPLAGQNNISIQVESLPIGCYQCVIHSGPYLARYKLFIAR